MRAVILTIIAFFSLATATPAFAQKEDVIDTGSGLTFEKPSGWVVSPDKKGATAALYAAGDKKSQIEFRFAEMESTKSKQYFNTFHGSLTGAGLRKVKADSRKFGKLQGTLTEYRVGGERPMQIYVFQFVAKKGAWLVVGMFDAEQAKNYLADYEALLSLVVVD